MPMNARVVMVVDVAEDEAQEDLEAVIKEVEVGLVMMRTEGSKKKIGRSCKKYAVKPFLHEYRQNKFIN